MLLLYLSVFMLSELHVSGKLTFPPDRNWTVPATEKWTFQPTWKWQSGDTYLPYEDYTRKTQTEYETELRTRIFLGTMLSDVRTRYLAPKRHRENKRSMLLIDILEYTHGNKLGNTFSSLMKSLKKSIFLFF